MTFEPEARELSPAPWRLTLCARIAGTSAGRSFRSFRRACHVDEAGLAGTRNLDTLLALAEQHGATIRLLGDYSVAVRSGGLERRLIGHLEREIDSWFVTLPLSGIKEESDILVRFPG